MARGRQARRHLGLRLRALRDADRPSRLSWRDGLGHDRENSRARAGLVGAPRGDARSHSTPLAPLPRQGSEAAPDETSATSGSRSTRSTSCGQCHRGARWRVRLPPGCHRTWLPWVALVALAASVGVWEARRAVTTPENPLANAQFTRFTDWEGTEGGAEISPDGKFVAFLADRDGQFDIWLSQVGTGRFSQSHGGYSRRCNPSGPPFGTSAFRATARKSGSVLTPDRRWRR